MDPFAFHAPTQVAFGVGVRRQLRHHLSGGSWGVLSSPSVRAYSGVSEVLEDVDAQGTELVSLGSVSPNPRLSEVEAACEVGRKAQIVGVIAAGGGSVLDAGKLTRIALMQNVSAREALDHLATALQRPASRHIPLIAIPTTAGTGAEVSRGAIITDDRSGSKRAARGTQLVPDVALIDPELTYSLPARRTAETGFDVIAHAIETFLSRAATPVTDILARAALSVAPKALLSAVADPNDKVARQSMALHAWLMGYNLAHASTCLPHRMQYPIGAATDTSHQVGLAVLYPAWLRRVTIAAPARAEEVTTTIAHAMEPFAPARTAHQVMSTYLERLGLRLGLSDLGLAEADLDGLAESVTGRTDLDPIGSDRSLIRTILAESLHA